MIKKKKTIKKLLMLLITIITIFNNTGYVKAAYGGTASGGSDDDELGSCSDGPASFHACDSDKGWTATCNKSIEYKESSYVYPNVWYMDGTYLGDPIVLDKMFQSSGLKGILAGTHIGLDVYEEKKYSITVNIGSVGIQEYHRCQYICKNVYNAEDGCKNASGLPADGCVEYISQAAFEIDGTKCPKPEGDCKISVDITKYKCRESCPAAYEKCKNKHKPSRIELNPSYTGEFPNSNDINDPSGSITIEPTLTYEEVIEDDGEWYWYIEETKRFSYKLGKACINAKTGEVRYVVNGNDCDLSKDEYAVDENEEYWKYFIPLNANSANGISVYLNPIEGSGIVSAGICESIMSNHPDSYNKVIRPVSGGTLSGNPENDKKKVSSGCYWASTITIPVEQKFYNELENGINFKGFNFYYKPIDISNPFPNGLNNTSIWHDWNKSNPDISKSFDKVTYSAKTSGNEDKIRDYTKSNPYTSWENMNINGTSNFIKNEGVVTGSGNLNSFYNLGCGPENDSSQPECGRR